MKLQVIIEKGDDVYAGRVEGRKDFLPVTMADDIPGVLQNLKELIEDYKKHEGKGDKFWDKINVENLEFDLVYDLQVFFQEHEYLNIAAIARRAGMNETLLRQYARGYKFPSAEQAKRIEAIVHSIASELQSVSIGV
ncbi:MerR family transcriptional regulator [Filimonas effusa]|uniref:Uncharacterized protein n=1 Tax=Filimonas effusa TaxID=2508721 RepID=A0A4Q1D318_9BACT|nr:hypothetical protein [Filimonas effusa]RXK81465.1 hypothetical protein ESB13_21280 [Filimonas effusa]